MNILSISQDKQPPGITSSHQNNTCSFSNPSKKTCNRSFVSTPSSQSPRSRHYNSQSASSSSRHVAVCGRILTARQLTQRRPAGPPYVTPRTATKISRNGLTCRAEGSVSVCLALLTGKTGRAGPNHCIFWRSSRENNNSTCSCRVYGPWTDGSLPMTASSGEVRRCRMYCGNLRRWVLRSL